MDLKHNWQCLRQVVECGRACRNTNSLFFLNVSLCLSRACLGKVIVFSINMAQKGIFRTVTPRVALVCRAARGPFTCRQNHLVSSFFYVCPEPVLANVQSLVQKRHRTKDVSAPGPRVDRLPLESIAIAIFDSVPCARKTHRSRFKCFPYVCPEPVLVK